MPKGGATFDLATCQISFWFVDYKYLYLFLTFLIMIRHVIIIHVNIFIITFFHFAKNPVPVTLRSEWNSTDILWLLLVTCVTIFKVVMLLPLLQRFYLV